MLPIRLYVFVSFLFFLLLTYVSNQSIKRNRENFPSIQIDNTNTRTDNEEFTDQLRIMLEGKLSEPELQNLIKEFTATDTLIESSQKSVDLGIKMGDQDLDIQYIIDNPEIFIGRFYKLFSWALFLLMPFYGMLLWLFFHQHRPNYLPHFVMSINQHVFIFLIFSIIMLVQLILPGKTAETENYLVILAPVYAFIGAKRFYRSRWYSVLFRLIGVFFIYMFVTIFTTVAVLYFAIT